MLFQKGKLKVRQLEEKDQRLLEQWLTNPVVLKFYEGRDQVFDAGRVKQEFYTSEPGLVRGIIEFGETAIGYIQYYPLPEKERSLFGYSADERVYGTDQLIGETAYWNMGIGKVLVKAVVEHLVKTKQADKVVMDPQEWNERAIRCYERCGFEKVKLLRDHEWHEGAYHDCWLMECRPT